MSEDVKPCPFCGSRAVQTATSGASWMVACLNCVSEGGPRGTEDEAIAAWNRRATPTPAPDSAAGEVEGWRPIETAPRDGTEVLVSYGYGFDAESPLVVAWSKRRKTWVLVGPETMLPVPTKATHWRPLPAPPVAALASDAGREGV